MSINKISDGLREREREKSVNTIPLGELRGAPASVGDVNALASATSLKTERLRTLADNLSKHLEKVETRKRAEFDAVGKIRAENGAVTDTLSSSQRKKMLADAMKAERKSAIAAFAEERIKLESEIREAKGKLDAVRSLYGDPTSLLKRTTYGDAKVARYRDDLQFAGPTELEQALQQAIVTQDKELGAACLQRLDAMPKNVRNSVRVNRKEVAKNLIADEWLRARRNVAALEIAVESGVLAAREAAGLSVPSTAKIGLGIKKREFAGLLSEGADNAA